MLMTASRYGKLVNIGNNASTLVLRSAEAIHGSLGHGEVIYGKLSVSLTDMFVLMVH